MYKAQTLHRHGRWHAANAHRGDLIAQAISCGLSRQEAEDVASESILRAGVKDDLDLDRAGGWLRTVAHHLAMDAHRRAPSARAVGRLRSSVIEAHEPHAAVDDRLEAEWVANVVAQLPPRQQLALHYRAAGFSLEEIASRMSETYKSVESLISRGRNSVRKAIATTLGVLGLGFFRRQRMFGVSAPVAGVVVAASMTIWAWSSLSHPPGADAAGPQPTVAGAALEGLPMPGAPRVRPAHPAAEIHAPAGRRTTSTKALVPGGAVGPIRHGGISVTRSRQDESMLDSTVRCLRDGLDLNPDALGCR